MIDIKHLSDEDKKHLEELLKNAERLVAMAEYQEAKSIVVKRWQKIVIGFAAFIVAMVALFGYAKTGLKWLTQ